MSIKKRLLALTTVVVMLASSFVAFADTIPTLTTSMMTLEELLDNVGDDTLAGLKISLNNFNDGDTLDVLNMTLRLSTKLTGFGQTGGTAMRPVFGTIALTDDNFKTTAIIADVSFTNSIKSTTETDAYYDYWTLAASPTTLSSNATIYLYFAAVDDNGEFVDANGVITAEDIVILNAGGRFLGGEYSIPKIAVKNTSTAAAPAVSGAQASGSDRSWQVVMPMDMLSEAMSTQLYNKTKAVWAEQVTNLVLKSGVTFTGDGDATINVKTTIKDAQNAEDVLGLKFKAGDVASLSPECE